MNAKQQEFLLQGGAPSQVDALIAALHAADGQWVGLPQLVDAVGGFAIHSRVSDARKMGCKIENRVEFQPLTKKRLSFYRMIAP